MKIQNAAGRKISRSAKIAAFGILSAYLMNSCHSPRNYSVTPFSGKDESPFQGEWKGPYFIYGYPSEKSRHSGLIKINIDRGFVSGRLYYNGKEGELSGVVDDDGDFSSSIKLDYGLFSTSSNLDGKILLDYFSSKKYSADMLGGEFTLSINGSSYKGDLLLLPSHRAAAQRKNLEKILTSIHNQSQSE